MRALNSSPALETSASVPFRNTRTLRLPAGEVAKAETVITREPSGWSMTRTGAVRSSIAAGDAASLGSVSALSEESSSAGVRGGGTRSRVAVSYAPANWSRRESSYAPPRKLSPTGIRVSSISPIGTVTLGIPRWRGTRLPLATQVPFRHASSADRGEVSESERPMSATAGKTTASRPRSASQSSKSTRRVSSSPSRPSRSDGMSASVEIPTSLARVT